MEEMQIGSGAILSGMFWLTFGLAMLVVAVAVSLAIVAAVWNGANPFSSLVSWFQSYVSSWFRRSE